jgi:DNA-binding beta-propeller fold protein YncE
MLATKLRAATTSVFNPAWNVAYAYYDPPANLAGNLSTVEPINSVNIESIETASTGVFLSPDLSRMYIIGTSGDDVNQWTLNNPGSIASMTFVQSFSVSAQETTPQDLFFKPDGLKMYILGSSGDEVNEYNLSTAWDISTASYLQNFSVAAQETGPTGIFFKPDGLKMYIVGLSGDDVNEYNLSTAWDISTASFLQNFSVAAQETNPEGLSFSLGGTKMYILGSTGDDVNEYDLSTAWDISTASFVQVYSVTFTVPGGVFVSGTGGNMYVTGSYNDGVTTEDFVRSYSLGGFSVAGQEASPTDLFFKPDGTKMYIVGSNGDEVNEYNLSTAWDISTASYLQNFSVAAQEAIPQDLFFKPDGTKMYIVGSSGDDVNEYNLSTAWDISTASYLQNFSVAAQETAPTGIFFKPDGTKMYILGISGDDVNEYDLSTAWDISTASFLQNFFVIEQEVSPGGIFFKPDGLKMYIVGSTGNEVNEYDLSTAWDVSTASFLQNFSVAAQSTNPEGLFFKPDGTKMYIMDGSDDKVFQYSIGIQE